MPDIVIAGAGIAGVSAAFHLARSGSGSVLLCDPRPALTLTSDKSTECYRNWWPGPDDTMVGLMNRSIDLLETYAAESNDFFHLSRRGYLYATAERSTLDRLTEDAASISALGGGTVRLDEASAENGADLYTSSETIRGAFPFLTDDVVGGLHVRRAGWLSAQQLGSWWLDEARSLGVRTAALSVDHVATAGGAITGVGLSDGSVVPCDVFVNAAGPMAPAVGDMTGVSLPLSSEAHLKVAIKDWAAAVPRSAPMMIWCDSQTIDWDAGERSALGSEGRPDLLGSMPPFCHGRPEGPGDSPWVLALWEYHKQVVEPRWPIPTDPLYAEVVLRGMSRMIPGLRVYREALPESVIDGGYYTKTPENRPLIGPSGPDGSFVIAGFSGFGIMAAAAAGELLAGHVSRTTLPHYAPFLAPSRYEDPRYAAVMAAAGDGQL